jgi:hypothetical protein
MFDVGRSMFDVLFFSLSRKKNLSLMGIHGVHEVFLDTHPDFCHFTSVVSDSSIFRTSNKE